MILGLFYKVIKVVDLATDFSRVILIAELIQFILFYRNWKFIKMISANLSIL